ncbi:helix-turn-helix transcriptional regulator [Pseudoxanthomonas sp. 10H]|uniref:helix-turn-helix transcriptional regulator n=1 Tax=Pseudoxanthomonas sp. 10H TaxID=3242729 RepID=UPI003558DF00
MLDDAVFDGLLESLYGSVLDHDQLDVFNRRLAQATDSHITGVMIHDVMFGRAEASRIHGVDMARLGAMLDGQDLRDDLWMQRATPQLETCRILDSEAMVERRVAQRSDFFNAYYRRLDIVQQIACVGLFDGANSVTLSICHGDPDRHYGPAEKRLLQRLTPHWVNAYAMMRRLQGLERRAGSLAQALDAAPVAMFALSRELRLSRTNAAGDQLLERGVLQRAPDGRLAGHGAAARPLLDLLQRAVRGRGLLVGGDVERVVLRDGDDRAGLVVTAHPTAALAGDGAEALLVFVREVHRPAAALEPVLQALFGLTAGEARLAAAMHRHADAALAAQACGITPATAQSRLKLIYGKTGERSQSALGRLLSAVAASGA